MAIHLLEIHLPEYQLDVKPDYLKIGQKVDLKIEQHLPDGQYLYRAIGKDDHPNHSLNELVKIILKQGTDKYNPSRKEICFEEFCSYNHDIQAGSFEIKNEKIVLEGSYEIPSLVGDTIKKFYENVLLDRGYRVRIDLIIIYHANKFSKAEKIDQNAERVRPALENCLYRFRDPEHKREALAAIVKILR